MTPAEMAAMGATILTSGWLGNVLIQALKNRTQNNADRINADIKLEQHRDALTIQLLEQARIEAAQLREELQRLRLVESHSLHFEEALRLLGLLLSTPVDDRRQIENEASAFVNRMNRGREARGYMRNEAQRIIAATAIAERNNDEDRVRED